MLADLVREFCKENKYEVCENYSKCIKTAVDGEVLFEETITTIGIIVEQDCAFLETVEELGNYIIAKKLDEQVLGQVFDELEAVSMDELGPDGIIYFPYIQDYQPPQP